MTLGFGFHLRHTRGSFTSLWVTQTKRFRAHLDEGGIGLAACVDDGGLSIGLGIGDDLGLHRLGRRLELCPLVHLDTFGLCLRRFSKGLRLQFFHPRPRLALAGFTFLVRLGLGHLQGRLRRRDPPRSFVLSLDRLRTDRAGELHAAEGGNSGANGSYRSLDGGNPLTLHLVGLLDADVLRRDMLCHLGLPKLVSLRHTGGTIAALHRLSDASLLDGLRSGLLTLGFDLARGVIDVGNVHVDQLQTDLVCADPKPKPNRERFIP